MIQVSSKSVEKRGSYGHLKIQYDQHLAAILYYIFNLVYDPLHFANFAIVSVVPAGAIQISVNQDGSPIAQGLQTLTMTNANPATTTANSASAGATIVQYAQGPDGQQYYIPGN